MRFQFLLSLAALPALAQAQTTTPAAGFQRLPSGTEYRLFRRDAAGRYAPQALAALMTEASCLAEMNRRFFRLPPETLASQAIDALAASGAARVENGRLVNA